MSPKQRLVVIGNGMAGARLVEEIAARDGPEEFDITVFGDEPRGAYNRILLSRVLAGAQQAEDIFLSSADWRSRHGVTLHQGARIGWIDRVSKTVYAPGGLAQPFDKLVIATGSSPFVPPMAGLYDEEGVTKPGVFTFRSLEDCDRLIEAAKSSSRAVVIGGGLLGLEAASGLAARGLDVHVAHLNSYLMDTQLDSGAAAIMKQTLEGEGVSFRLNALATAILGDAAVRGVQFKDGACVECDIVVVAAGTRPNVELAKQAGLKVQRGIVVGDTLACRNDPNVFAIGECAQHRDKVYGLVGPAWEQAHVLAERLTGRAPDLTYGGSRVATRLKVMGVSLAALGDKEPTASGDEVVLYSDARRGVYKKLILRDDRIVGAIILGDGMSIPGVWQAYEGHAPLPRDRAELLFPYLSELRAPSVSDLPDTARVCNCNGVPKGAIASAALQGCDTVKKVGERTRAGTGCGMCKPQIQAILDLMLSREGAAHTAAPVPAGVAA